METVGLSWSDFYFPTGGFLGVLDFFLALIYLIFIYFFAYLIKFRFYRNSPIKEYLIPGLTAKVIGAMAVCLIYNYYYKGGDTSYYFNEARLLLRIFFAKPVVGLRLFWASGGEIPLDLKHYMLGFNFANSQSAYLVVKFCAVVSIFTFQSFLVSSILFGFLSFWGIFKIFELFAKLYPKLTSKFAIPFLYIPSVFFWGSGILKDTICLTCLSLLFYFIYEVFLLNRKKPKYFVGIAITIYLLAVIKIYIIMAFFICVLLFLYLNYIGRFRSPVIKFFISPLLLVSFVGLAFGVLWYIGESSEAGLYSLDNIMSTAEVTRAWIYSNGGSNYSLGQTDNSIWGFIKVFPAGVNVTLFRPYIWEVRNAVGLLSALESLGIFILTIAVIFRLGLNIFLRVFLGNKLVLFCLIFSIIFAYSVGVTSYNFGTLVRYKIPCIPFYVSSILIIYYIGKDKKMKRNPDLEHTT